LGGGQHGADLAILGDSALEGGRGGESPFEGARLLGGERSERVGRRQVRQAIGLSVVIAHGFGSK
jgi:hypothetical protein